jgi:PAS domain S-box-containing protein
LTGHGARPDFFNKVTEEIINRFTDYHKKVLDTGETISTEASIATADGHEVTFVVEMFTLGGKAVGGYATKLTVQPNRNQIERDNERLLNLLHVASNAIWEWDIKTGETFRNKALLEMIGYSPRQTKGLSWWLEHIHPEDAGRVNDHINEVINNQENCWSDKYRLKCSDGSYKYVSDRGLIIYEQGMPVKMIGSLRDVTEVKELENQLAEERLIRQKEFSENVIKVLEREKTLIGYELHDNINPLLAVSKLYVGMLQPANDEEKEIKNKSMEQIAAAIEEIRNLSREMVIPHLKKKGLVPSIKELIENINFSKSLSIQFYHDHKTYPISSGKKVTLFRIIQEQLRNILRHSQATEVKIRLTASAAEVQLEIADNGIGFDAAKKIQGIGLSNIHERTGFYNGTVLIDTAEGKGCKVIVKIPIY